jgi:hypothetical protein
MRMIKATATVATAVVGLCLWSATAHAGTARAAIAATTLAKDSKTATSKAKPKAKPSPPVDDSAPAADQSTDGSAAAKDSEAPHPSAAGEPPADRAPRETGAPSPPATGAAPARPRAPPPPPVEPTLVAPETEAILALERARAAYEYGDMEMVVDSARIVAEGRALPTPIQRVQALRFLGIGLFLTGRTAGAEAAFFELLRQKPGAKLDPTHTRPDVVAFFETVRSRHASEIQQARPSKYLLLAFLPPAGQFQNGDRARGITLAAVEAVSLGLAIGSYVQLKSWQNKNDLTFPGHTDDARSLKIVNNLSVAIFAATVAVGIIDGVANFHHTADEPPLAWLTPNGLGFRF